jgi:hypothetical protein
MMFIGKEVLRDLVHGAMGVVLETMGVLSFPAELTLKTESNLEAGRAKIRSAHREP